MGMALKQAEKGARLNEVPVGAVIVRDGEVIAAAHNGTIETNDPTAHAEISALRESSRKIGNYRLTGCDLYVTLEPCAMCLGAAVQARIRSIIYGAPDPKSGAVESVMRFPFERLNHHLDIRGGILKEECGRILKEFFRKKR